MKPTVKSKRTAEQRARKKLSGAITPPIRSALPLGCGYFRCSWLDFMLSRDNIKFASRNTAEWTVNGFKITMYKADHPPLHCHVRKDGNFIGKRHKAQANAAIAKWRRENGI